MLQSSYNLNRLGCSTAGDLINTTATVGTFDGLGGLGGGGLGTNLGGSSTNLLFGTSPPFNTFGPLSTTTHYHNPTNLTTGTTGGICGGIQSNTGMYPSTYMNMNMCGGGGGGITGQTSFPTTPPRRRNSIGGLPSASMTEYLNMLQQNADIAHLSNLLNETKTSITRSSQILCRGENLHGDILLSQAAGDVLLNDNYHMISKYNNDANDMDITGANILNQMPIAYSSQPNIYYSQPNYTNSHIPTDLYMSRFKRATATAPFNASRYAMCSKLHSINNPVMSAYHNNPCTGSSECFKRSAMLQQHQQLPSSSYTSYLLQHQPSSTSHQQLHNYQQQYHANKYKQPPPPYSSVLNPNHHFLDSHHLNSNRSYSKLDLLDYTKQGEQNKRQVSFNIDVDTLSITS